jgi:hypothetical protein
MLIQKLNDCEEIIAGDGTVLRELLHPDKQDINLRYSLAHAILPVGKTSIPYSLKTSEVYSNPKSIVKYLASPILIKLVLI